MTGAREGEVEAVVDGGVGVRGDPKVGLALAQNEGMKVTWVHTVREAKPHSD